MCTQKADYLYIYDYNAPCYMFRPSIAMVRDQHQYLKPNKTSYIYNNKTSQLNVI